MDPAGPFSWKLSHAFYQTNASSETCPGTCSNGSNSFSDIAEEDEVSNYDDDEVTESPGGASLCTEDEDWRTAEGASIASCEAILIH